MEQNLRSSSRRPGVAAEIAAELKLQEERQLAVVRLVRTEAELGRLSTLLRRGLLALGVLAGIVFAVVIADLAGFFAPTSRTVEPARSLSQAVPPVQVPNVTSTPAVPGTENSPAAARELSATAESIAFERRHQSSAAPAVEPTTASSTGLAASERSTSFPSAPPRAPGAVAILREPIPLHPQATFSGGYDLKAAMLLRIVEFVEWPPAAFSAPGAPFLIGVLGDDPFGVRLESTFAQHSVAGHPFTIRRSHELNDLLSAHLLFISPSEQADYGNLLATLQGRSILTIGETAGFAARGGMIEFQLERQKVRFILNPAAAKKAGLNLNPRLLKLAQQIIE